MITRRVTFKIKDFLEDLEMAIENKTERIDDIVQTYKSFLNRASDDIKVSVMSYVDRQILNTDNQEVKSYIKACHKSIFVK